MEALIFDMDGTIIDSEGIWRSEQLRVLRKVGLQPTNDFLDSTVGVPLEIHMKECFESPLWNKSISLSEACDDIVLGVTNGILTNAEFINGVETLLINAKKLGFKIGLATSSPKVIMDAVVHKLKLDKYISVFCSSQFELYGKPHPAVYYTAAHKLGVENKKCIVFEDSITGMVAGKSASMFTVVIPHPDFRNNKRFNLADIQFNSCTEISFDWLLKMRDFK